MIERPLFALTLLKSDILRWGDPKGPNAVSPINVNEWSAAVVKVKAAGGSDPDVDAVLRFAGGQGDMLCRDDLSMFCRSGNDRQALLASQMWGHGSSPLNPGGRKRFQDKVASLLAPNLPQVLDNTRAALTRTPMDFGAAFRQLETVDPATGGKVLAELGVSYWSKYLYALGKSLATNDNYPLILDSKVAVSLTELLGTKQQVGLALSVNEVSAEEYECYCRCMRRWATCLDVQPDELEFFLWDRSSSGRRIRPVCQAL